MFSGKTEELIRRMRRAQFAKQRVEIFKPAIDVRYSQEDVVSHDQKHIQSTPVDSSASILLLAEDIEVVGIDEAQFFDEGIVEVCNQLANRGVRVIIAGLDMDFKGVPFGPMPALCAIADDVTKVHAICVKCGSLAYVSHRKVLSDKRVLPRVLPESDTGRQPKEIEMYDKPITFDKFVRWMGYGLLILAIIILVNYLGSVLLPFAAAWLLAYLLYPMVKFVQYKLHVPGRVLSIVVTLIVVIAILTGIAWLIIPPMIEQFERLSELVTAYIQTTAKIDSIPDAISQWTQEHRRDLETYMRSENFTEGIKDALPQMFSVVGKTASILISIAASLITLLYMFFILMDYEYLTENWIKIFPKKSRPFWSVLAKDAERELSNYIRGQGLVAFIMGVLFCIGFTIIDFPMAIGLGILIGILDLVPYLHTFALIPTALLALLKAADTGQNFWIVFAMAVAVFAVVQVIIDLIVTPYVMGKAMRLNPAILLLSLSVWGALLGFIGLIIALPATTLLIAYYQRYITRENEEIITESEKSSE